MDFLQKSPCYMKALDIMLLKITLTIKRSIFIIFVDLLLIVLKVILIVVNPSSLKYNIEKENIYTIQYTNGYECSTYECNFIK